jgi:hypothetical protein
MSALVERLRPAVFRTPITTSDDIEVALRILTASNLIFSCPLLWGRALHHEIGKLDIVHLHTLFLWPLLAQMSASFRWLPPFARVIAWRTISFEQVWLARDQSTRVAIARSRRVI